MTLLYIIIGLTAIYLAYSFGIKKGVAKAVQVVDEDNNVNSHNHVHNRAQAAYKNHSGGCC